MTDSAHDPERCCTNCIHFDRLTEGGLCRLAPPSPSTSYWPRVQESDWCGQLFLKGPKDLNQTLRG